MSIITTLKKVPGVDATYRAIKKRRLYSQVTHFDNRSQNSEKLCIILAGYKPFTWDAVFDRVHEFLDSDIEVCIGSSGKYDVRLKAIAESYGWSYMATKQNNVSALQNTIIKEFSSAKYIFKLDEDIFVTKGVFSSMFGKLVEPTPTEINLTPGFIAPLIPINGYCYHRVLKKFGLEQDYMRRFGEINLAAGSAQKIENELEVARYFWGAEDSPVGTIDEMADFLRGRPDEISICPIRFSIGCILFTRELWNNMHGFATGWGTAMGLDEVTINEYCVIHSMPMVVDENSLVGHLSFGKQNPGMKSFFHKNVSVFSLPR